MSKDAKIAHACPHYIRGERAELINGNYIFPLSPPTSNVIVSRDGIEIPSQGLKSKHRLTFMKKQPYRFKAGKNVIKITGRELVIPPNKTYNAVELSALLNQGLRGTDLIAETVSAGVSLSSDLDAFDLEGEALNTSLGFSKTTAKSSQRTIAPGWGLVQDTDRKIIKFNKTLDPEGLLQISYLTEKRFCRRCGSTGVENDFEVSADGSLTLVQDHNLLYQIVAKAVLTEIGSNPFYSWYGSRARSLIGSKSTSGIKQILRQYIRECLDRVIDIQTSQSKIQTVTARERISQIEGIEVTDLDEIGSSLLCTITVRSASLERVNVNIIFSVPGSISLDGDLA